MCLTTIRIFMAYKLFSSLLLFHGKTVHQTICGTLIQCLRHTERESERDRQTETTNTQKNSETEAERYLLTKSASTFSFLYENTSSELCRICRYDRRHQISILRLVNLKLGVSVARDIPQHAQWDSLVSAGHTGTHNTHLLALRINRV